MIINKKVPFSYIINKIKYDIIYVIIIGVSTHYLTHVFNTEIPELPIAIPAFIGTAISVILSFKINQSYGRWWEARKIWGAIVNDSRTFVLQLQSFFPKENQKEIKEIAYRQIAWCYSLGQNLRGLNPLENIDKFISEKDMKDIESHSNKPLGILQKNALQIAELKNNGIIDIFSMIQINNTLVEFSNSMGKAERIKSTVFPKTYLLFLHFFIYIFVVTLSISLSDFDYVYELPLLLVLSSTFFLLEKSATHLQDPFNNKPTDTAMTAIATTIEINIKDLLGEKEKPNPLKSDTFYLL